MSFLPGLTVLGLGHCGLGSPHDHGLEILRPGHAAHPAAPGGPVVFIDDRSEADQILPRLADRTDRNVVAVAVAQDLDGLVYALAPEIVRGADLDGPVLHEGVDGTLGPALEEQRVEAGPPLPRGAPAADVAVRNGARQGRLGNDREPAAHRRLTPGQRTVDEGQQIVGRHRIDLRSVVEQVLHAQSARPDVEQGVGLIDPLIGDRSARQIDPCHMVCVSTECHECTPSGCQHPGAIPRAD